MLNHPTGLFSGDYNSALRGYWPLKFLHTLQLPKMYFKSYLGHRAASCCALPHISSYFFYYTISISRPRDREEAIALTADRDTHAGTNVTKLPRQTS